MRPCFKFNVVSAAAGAGETADLDIFDEIGFWGVQAADFIRDLKAIKASTINVSINSPGGDVFAGLAIYNALKGSGKEIVVKVMGVAASAASLIAMAGDKIVMPKNTFMMVHNPWSFAMGNADELRDTADTLDKIGASLQATYVAKTGQPEDKIKELLAKDTWLSADEALELGFATEVVDDVKANAKFDMARADLPENVKAMFLAAVKPVAEADPVDPPADDETPVTEQIEALAKAAGLEAHAAVLAVSCKTVDEAKTRIGEAREIKALCVVAKKPDLAQGLIASSKTVSEVRAQLVKAMAEDDEATHTDSTPKNQGSKTGNSATPQVSTDSLWASHHKASKASK